MGTRKFTPSHARIHAPAHTRIHAHAHAHAHAGRRKKAVTGHNYICHNYIGSGSGEEQSRVVEAQLLLGETDVSGEPL